MAAESMKKDVMLDIETLSTRNDALVLSIAAIPFDCIGQEGPWMGDPLFLVPDMIEQIVMGRHVDQNTQEFWQKQPLEASEHWRNPNTRSTVRSALMQLDAFVAGAPRIWANGIVFDIGILESLYRLVGLVPPWKYNAIRDARTFYDTNTSDRPKLELPETVILHHPITDCRLQINRLWEHGWSQ
jgi:hypothetical protein